MSDRGAGLVVGFLVMVLACKPAGKDGGDGGPQAHTDGGPLSEVPSSGQLSCDGFRAVASGESLTCALKADGTVWCWGQAPVGDGTTTDRLLPSRVEGLSDVTQIAVGRWHGCARKSDRSVWCWGRNAMGQVDATRADWPAPVRATETPAVAVVASGRYSCALSDTGDMVCWGERPIAPVADTNAIEIAIGDTHACLRQADLAVWCLGDNSNGELGNGAIGGNTRIAMRTGISDATAIDIGLFHTVALRQDGTVWWWGWDALLGKTGTPTQVPGLAGVSAVSAGQQHSCALTSQGNVRCWGLGENGRLGSGSANDASTPVAVALDGVAQVSAGNTHTCAVLNSGAVHCWGYNDVGQLGNGTTATSLRPTKICGN